ncbi:MAG: arginase family protein [Chloroflexi bacterium]|nr:arginase family protein [Chloroflexota bacterium]
MTADGSAPGNDLGSPRYAFAGIPSFLRAKICTDLDQLDADIAVIGVPTDEGSPFMPGSRFGPRSIREHSLRFGTRGFYDHDADQVYLSYELENKRIADVGDADVWPTDVEGTFRRITEAVEGILKAGAMPVVLGGDHAITFPVVRAYSEPLHVVHFDAHIDYSPFMHGFEYSNSHAFRHIHHMSHVQSLTQVGIRSLRNVKDWVDDSISDGNRVIGMAESRELGPKGLAELLPEGARCYVSIDIDVLDMPLVPGCVSAEPNGMSYAELRDDLFALAEHLDIVGFDLVEVNPQLDVGTGITSYLAAHTILEFLGRICVQPRWIARRGKG